MAPVVDERRAPSAAFAVANDFDDDNDWDLEGTFGLDEVERDGAKRHLRDIQDSCRGKKRKVLGTIAEPFEFATEFVNQMASTDTGSSFELVSFKDGLGTTEVTAEEAKE